VHHNMCICCICAQKGTFSIRSDILSIHWDNMKFACKLWRTISGFNIYGPDFCGFKLGKKIRLKYPN
jgi:hypothetical protein